MEQTVPIKVRHEAKLDDRHGMIYRTAQISPLGSRRGRVGDVDLIGLGGIGVPTEGLIRETAIGNCQLVGLQT